MASRLEKLKSLEERLLATMAKADEKSLAPLAKQYRDTIREIEEIEGAPNADDEIGGILAARASHGKPGAVRKGRAKVQRE